MTLTDIQKELLKKGRGLYTGGLLRAIWQAPCGGGKTVIASEQTRLALEKGIPTQEEPIIHIVHRRRLVDQMGDTLARFGISSSPVMEGRPRWPALVLCASRDTLLAMLKNGDALPRGRLLIWDECHVAAREIQQWYLDNCPNAYWTGYTATPVRPDGSSLAPPYQALACMAPASKLIEAKRLCRVKVFNPDAVGRRRRKGDKVKPVGDPVAHWKKYALDLPTVVFAATVADSQGICARYNEAGIAAEHIDASTPEDEREDVFERSRKGITKVICNCGVLVEGIDLPWLVCCQILRGCNSLVLWVQATGRIMRFFEGKEFGIVLDHSGAAHEFGLPDSDYVWALDDGKANEKANKPPKDRKPVTCPKCGAMFLPKPSCPECGAVLPLKKRKSVLASITHGDGLLTEFNGHQEAAIKQDTLNRLFTRLLFIGRAKGWPMSRVAAVFSKEAGCAPWEASLDHPLPYGKAEWATPVKTWMESNRR